MLTIAAAAATILGFSSTTGPAIATALCSGVSAVWGLGQSRCHVKAVALSCVVGTVLLTGLGVYYLYT